MKGLYELIRPIIGKGGIWKYIFLGIASGLFSFLFINLVTIVIKQIVSGNYKTISREYIIIFSFIILFVVWIRRTLSFSIINITQKLFWDLRKQILHTILKANYQQFLNKKNEIYSSIVNDVNILTHASTSIIDFSTSLLVGIACLIYLLSISWILFLITISIAIIGVTIYQLSSIKDHKNFMEARELENDFVSKLNMIINGFKEIYIEPKKGLYIYNNQIQPISEKAYKTNVAANTGFLNNQIIGQILFYLLIVSILLIFSIILKIETGKIVSYVFILLYLLSSIETIMVLLPILMRAKVSAKHIVDLKNNLENSYFKNDTTTKHLSIHKFASITIQELEFEYKEKDDQNFKIGPINLNINKSEIIFIYGGNGSGKTTFIYTLLGLNNLNKGEILLNNEIINTNNYNEYRSVFCAVFSDFYLFDELFIEKINTEKFSYYLKLFEIDHKIKLDGKKFTTIDLSTGQKKRLALISALIEEKPVIIIDEWAADQDPYFRKKFYIEILPILKKEGFTIIAITHDDKYYYCADKLYKMEFGKLIQDKIISNISSE